MEAACERWTWPRSRREILSLRGRLGFSDDVWILGFRVEDDGRIVDPYRDELVIFDPTWGDAPSAVPLRYSAVCEMYCLLSVYSQATERRLLDHWISLSQLVPPMRRELDASDCHALFAYDRERRAELRWVKIPFLGPDVDAGDLGFEVRPLPWVPVRIVLWRGDEETGDGGSVLVDRSAETFLPNLVVELAGLTIWRLKNILDPSARWGYHELAVRELRATE